MSHAMVGVTVPKPQFKLKTKTPKVRQSARSIDQCDVDHAAWHCDDGRGVVEASEGRRVKFGQIGQISNFKFQIVPSVHRAQAMHSAARDWASR